jgi:hypothetical protein
MLDSPNERTIDIALRAVFCILGIAAIIWGGYTVQIAWQQSGFQQIASHLIAGDRFAAKVFVALTPQLDASNQGKWSHPSAARDVTLIRLRMFENVIVDGEQNLVDMQITKLHGALAKSLENAPADPFLWAVLFWLENTQNGYDQDHLKYLRMSYALGPNEGWIAVKRNRVALAIFRLLPADLAQDAKMEFVRMVSSRMYDQAADILVGPGWGIRSALLAGLNETTDLDRQLFVRAVFNLGYDIIVPGVQLPEKRPWQ